MITFSKTEKLLGYNPTALRKFTAYITSGTTPPKSVMDKLYILSLKDYNRVIKVLSDNDYIVTTKIKINGETHNIYDITDKGRELCRARCIKRMTRAQANKLFDEIIERVREVNDNTYYLYKVKKIILFGSYITNKQSIGDIDIAFELEFKHKVVETNNGLNTELVANKKRAAENNCYDFLKSFSFGRYEVEKFIKNKNPKIHITPQCDLEMLNVVSKVFPI